MVKRFESEGIRVPDRISVVGYDDDAMAVESHPFLSTVSVNKKELGRIGAELILKRIAAPAAPVVKLRLPVQFVPREVGGRCRRPLAFPAGGVRAGGEPLLSAGKPCHGWGVGLAGGRLPSGTL